MLIKFKIDIVPISKYKPNNISDIKLCYLSL